MLGSLSRGIYPFCVNFIKRKFLRALFEVKITIYIGFFVCINKLDMAGEVVVDALPYFDQGYDETGVREAVRL